MRLLLLSTLVAFVGLSAYAGNYEPGDYLVKLKGQKHFSGSMFSKQLAQAGVKAEGMKLDGWVHVQVPANKFSNLNIETLRQNPNVEYVQPNFKLGLKHTFNWEQQPFWAKAAMLLKTSGGLEDLFKPVPPDNPEIPATVTSGSGQDPMFDKQWGMRDAGVQSAWQSHEGSRDMIVAVIDTGVDYTHEDLIENMWRNPGEIPGNGIDDDHNGYIDDVVGWDFASKDNKPYDFTTSVLDMLMGGGNPGHGTHCAGNVAARGHNGKGISGVAPNVRVMALRFITEKGQGTSADAIEAINYAVKNGAKVLSNSWGSEGEDPGEAQENRALREAVQNAQNAGVLFVAAAGNGRLNQATGKGEGYDNDTDSKPGYPASYEYDNIISVAAMDEQGNLGEFSNWGQRTVDIGAPGVVVFSTVPANGYQDTVIDADLPLLGPVHATWDGTSMATPHVAGAAALYWSKYPNKSWKEVKDAILRSARPTPSIAGKTVSGGRLDVANLLNNF